MDGEAMLGLLCARGYGITPDADLADVIIVNTCGFIDPAKKESIGAILDMAEKKNTGRCFALIVTGCLSERYRGAFSEELPEVDAVLGTGEYGRICDIVDRFVRKRGLPGRENGSESAESGAGVEEDAPRSIHESSAGQRLDHLNAPRVLTSGAGFVYIKIAEGCDNHCTYCVIPSIRGPYVSRPRADIIADAERASAGRDIEAVLIAQDTTRYGTAGPESLCGLLEELSRVERVRWIRLMYAYPDRMDDLLIRQFAANPKLLPYLDMPIQHASDSVLRAMGRRYGRADLYGLVNKLRRQAPGIVLRTTVMTGFPGESEEDFMGLLDFIADIKFERLGVFAYSREEGTPAAAMGGQVAKKVAQKRRAQLLRVQAAIMSQWESSLIGREYEAIVDSVLQRKPSRNGRNGAEYRVRTYADAPDIDGFVRVRAGDLGAGDFVRIKVTGRDSEGLLGELMT
ncbi:MAG: 30S ribosomal protein S12 methylthiotransferase RimO [Oscillospiraceae bacterium]|nr:30S ribosomal protein S12 methylthiotransferase RimO [Oscillospiraceae bacterium]